MCRINTHRLGAWFGATSFYDPSNFTWPFGSHVAVVEVDPETGVVKLRRYVAVDDCGRVINPLLVDGQIHGGLAQGIAQALYEEAVYDENGQLVSGSLMDYAVPKADDLVNFRAGSHRNAIARQRPRRQRHRRGGNDRLQRRDRQRCGRRPGATGRETSRHAPQARAGVAGDPASPGKEVMAMPATRSSTMLRRRFRKPLAPHAVRRGGEDSRRRP